MCYHRLMYSHLRFDFSYFSLSTFHCLAAISLVPAMQMAQWRKCRIAADTPLILALFVAFQRRFSCFPPATFANLATRSRPPALHLGGNMENFAISANRAIG
jgi:hypothetical protein